MNLLKLFIITFLFINLFSCSNEFEIAGEFKKIPVVYGLVDSGKEFNYFRIEKAFIDPDVSAVEIARNPDSLYYGDGVTARITNLRNNVSVILERVDLSNEGITREDGLFAENPNIGYKFRVSDLSLQLNDELKFDLIDQSDQILTTATTVVVGEHAVLTSQPINPLRLSYDRDVSFGIRSTEQAARFYDLRVLINYEEVSDDNPSERISKTLEWVVDKGMPRGQSISTGNFASQAVFKVEGIEFYRFLQDNIEEVNGVTRSFVGVNLQFDAGGQELFNYINIGSANTGITSNQVIPSYTNMSNDAVGVFSSRITTVNLEPYNLNTMSSDSLRDGVFTKRLNFQ